MHTNRSVQTNFALVRKSRHSNRSCACAKVHEPSAVCKPLPLLGAALQMLHTIYAHGVWLLHTAQSKASIKAEVQLPAEHCQRFSEIEERRKKPRKETRRKTAFEQRSRTEIPKSRLFLLNELHIRTYNGRTSSNRC